MTALGEDALNVVGLVYIAAFGLDEGESLGALLAQGPVTPRSRTVHRLARLRLALRRRLRQPLAGRPRADPGPSPVRGSAAARVFRVHRGDGRAGVEVAAVVVSRRENDEAIPPDVERMFASEWERRPSRCPRATWRWSPIRRGHGPGREGGRGGRAKLHAQTERRNAGRDTARTLRPDESRPRTRSSTRTATSATAMSARPAAALPRQPRQLGPRAGRRARRGSTRGHVRQRRRRRHDRHDAEHRRSDGPRRDRVHRGDGLSAGRSARLLARQLRRAGDRAHPPRPPAARRARVLGTAGCGGDARLGAGGHRRGRRAGDELRRDTSPSSSPPRTRVAKRAGRPPGASSGGRATGTNRRRGRPARRSTTPSARGASRTTRCSSESPRSTSRCSSPTATATR